MGLSPKMAQTLARHSDIRLTLDVYTHIGVHDQTTAIGSLPAPPSDNIGPTNETAVLAATGTDGPQTPTSDKTASREVPTMVPSGAEIRPDGNFMTWNSESAQNFNHRKHFFGKSNHRIDGF